MRATFLFAGMARSYISIKELLKETAKLWERAMPANRREPVSVPFWFQSINFTFMA